MLDGQPGSAGCKAQEPPPGDEGCGKSLAWWFTEEPWRPNKNPDAPKARDVMTMASLPRQCRDVLEAPDPVSEAAVTIGGNGVTTAAAVPDEREADGATTTVGAPPLPVSAYTDAPRPSVPVPQRRPERSR